MKQVALFVGEKHKAVDVIREVIGVAQEGGFGPDAMRKRLKVIAAIDAAKGGVLVLEDADYAVLKTAINHPGYSVAHADLLQIIDDVNDAKTVTVAKTKAA